MPPATTALTLGGISFQNFDCPEKIESFGGGQKLVIHKFPGGLITSQDFGAFPPDMIKWSGQFFVDSTLGTIQSRVAALTQLRVNAQPVQLTFSFYTYLVRVFQFDIKPQLDWWQPYDIILIPVQDLNPWANPIGPQQQTPISPASQGSSLPGLTPPSAPTGGTNLTSGAAPSNSASTAGQVNNLADQNQTLTAEISTLNAYDVAGPITGAAAAGDLTFALGALTNFQQSLNNAIQQALTGTGNINSTSLQKNLSNAVSAIGPLALSKDPGSAAIGNTINATLGNITTSLNNAPAIGNTLAVTNPDLNAIALAQYGDATQWQIIAQANGLLTPRPIGNFNLIIPAAPN